MIQDKIGSDLCIFDVECTGLDVAKDRVVSLSVAKLGTSGQSMFDFFVNPGIPMSEEVIAVHGITNEEAAEWEPFERQVAQIWEVIRDCDLAGFNLLNYDIPILWEEFYRCGIVWELSGIRIIDVGNIFKKKEERTLSAAVQFYLGREHEGAHNAQDDVTATLEVLNAQLERYADLRSLSLEELATFSLFDERLDLAGKIVKGKDGRPTYNIGKARGTAVEDDLGFGYWMLGKDFSANTKSVLRGILQQVESAQIAARRTPEPEVEWHAEEDMPF